MLIKPKLEYTALLGDKIEISLQNFAIKQRISGIVFLFKRHFHLSFRVSALPQRGSSAACV